MHVLLPFENEVSQNYLRKGGDVELVKLLYRYLLK